MPTSSTVRIAGRRTRAEKTICTALRTVSGVDGVTAHDTQALISGFCYEAGYCSEVIAAIARGRHIARERNESVAAVDLAVRQAYLRSPFLDLRTRMDAALGRYDGRMQGREAATEERNADTAVCGVEESKKTAAPNPGGVQAPQRGDSAFTTQLRDICRENVY